MRFKSIYCLLAILLVIISCTTSETSGDVMNIGKTEAVEIANQEVERLGYNIKSMNVEVVKNLMPSTWSNSSDVESRYFKEEKNKLNGKEFWMIYYSPKVLKLGGDVRLFVDINNGDILVRVRGK